ncbi:Polyketide cyclase/dehydrase/lipid transport superfamily protein [Hirschfeldia incana]|nr:Polyketide cyclase/dehydrase/lipid transport superfamily protein [Hirschfeldia incana]
MQKKGEISEYREKLDKTFSSPELTDHESLKTLLRNQLCSSLECNENILDKRAAEVSKLLSMLRSVSMTDHQASKLTNDASSSSHSDWKIKQDLEDCRVMYRQGLEGSPLHTLLVEGYMDSPLEDCLCVSWETALYKNWWPQFTFPPFKILQGTCLHKVRTGEQVCLVRMKVPWPLSERELIVHYFLFEYFKDGLVVVLLNSISDLVSIGVSAKDIIPEPTSAVRIDLVGGFALQKITSQRSFVRVIGELDIKLDLVPPSLINFIARQIVGKGFKLYKKAAGSVAKLDEHFSRALADPLYINIRKAMYSTDKATEEEETLGASEVNDDSETKNKYKNDEDASENEHVPYRKGIQEIEEESVSSEERNVNGKGIRRQFRISPEVEQALGTLDRAINMVRNIKPVQEDEELPPNKSRG